MSVLLVPVAITVLLLLAAEGAAALLDEPWEACFPSVLFSGLLVMFLLGTMNQLLIGWWLALALYVALAGWAVAVRVRRRYLSASPAAVAVLALTVTGGVALRGFVFSSWDEFSHWGRVQRAAYLENALAPYADVYLRFRSYPPGAGLLGYFFSRMRGAFVEMDAVMATGLLLTAIFLPLLARVGWRRVGIVALWLGALLLVPTLFFDAFTTVYADTPMGLLLGYGLYLALAPWVTRRVWHLAPALAMLSLMKAIGVFFGLIVVVALLVRTLMVARAERDPEAPQSRRDRARPYLVAGLLAACAIVPNRLYALALHVGGREDLSWSRDAGGLWVDALMRRGDPGYVAMTDKFITALFKTGVSLRPFPISVSTWAVFLAAAIVLLAQVSRWRGGPPLPWRLALWSLGVGLVVHIIGMHYSYLAYFSRSEAEGLASFSRYAGSYLVAGAYLVVALALQLSARSVRTDDAIRMVAVALIGAFVVLGRPDTALLVLHRQPVDAARALRSESVHLGSRLRECGIEPGDRIYYLRPHTAGLEYFIFSYEMLQQNVSGWSVGEPKDKRDLWTKNLSTAEFGKTLADQDWVYVYSSNAGIDERYGTFAEGGRLAPDTLYRQAGGPGEAPRLEPTGC